MPAPRHALELLKEMLAIPSVNPQGEPGTEHVGEQALAEYVAAFLQPLGAQVTLEPVEPGRPNLRAIFSPGGEPRARLAFAPHLDTVSVAGMTIPPFDPVIREGNLYGRGSSDTKGPMAAALWALREWAQSAGRGRSQIEWTFLALMGEESGNDGAHAIARAGLASDLVLALEPTELRVVTAHKGVLWMEAVTTGLACHGATPELGRSAINAMRRALAVLEEELAPQLAKPVHPRLGCTTLNVGTIRGGSKINIVPDRCQIEIDCRYLPGLNPEALHAQLAQRLRAVAPELELTVQRTAPPLDTPEASPWVARLGAVSAGLTTAPWFSDASVLSAGGIPAVAVGPGSIAQAHTRDEFIRLADFEAGVDFFQRWIAAAEAAVA